MTFLQDKASQDLLKELEQVTSIIQFRGWRASFLQHHEVFLHSEQAHKAEKVYLNMSQNVNTCLELVLKLDQYKRQTTDHVLNNDCITASGRLLLAEMGALLTKVNDMQRRLLPGTQEECEVYGYNKFHVGAVLVADSFAKYDQFATCAQILKLLRTSLVGVADRQILAEMDAYPILFGTFCDVLSDLGLYDTMMKCREWIEKERELEKLGIVEPEPEAETVDEEKLDLPMHEPECEPLDNLQEDDQLEEELQEELISVKSWTTPDAIVPSKRRGSDYYVNGDLSETLLFRPREKKQVPVETETAMVAVGANVTPLHMEESDDEHLQTRKVEPFCIDNDGEKVALAGRNPQEKFVDAATAEENAAAETALVTIGANLDAGIMNDDFVDFVQQNSVDPSCFDDDCETIGLAGRNPQEKVVGELNSKTALVPVNAQAIQKYGGSEQYVELACAAPPEHESEGIRITGRNPQERATNVDVAATIELALVPVNSVQTARDDGEDNTTDARVETTVLNDKKICLAGRNPRELEKAVGDKPHASSETVVAPLDHNAAPTKSSSTRNVAKKDNIASLESHDTDEKPSRLVDKTLLRKTSEVSTPAVLASPKKSKKHNEKKHVQLANTDGITPSKPTGPMSTVVAPNHANTSENRITSDAGDNDGGSTKSSSNPVSQPAIQPPSIKENPKASSPATKICLVGRNPIDFENMQQSPTSASPVNAGATARPEGTASPSGKQVNDVATGKGPQGAASPKAVASSFKTQPKSEATLEAAQAPTKPASSPKMQNTQGHAMKVESVPAAAIDRGCESSDRKPSILSKLMPNKEAENRDHFKSEPHAALVRADGASDKKPSLLSKLMPKKEAESGDITESEPSVAHDRADDKPAKRASLLSKLMPKREAESRDNIVNDVEPNVYFDEDRSDKQKKSPFGRFLSKKDEDMADDITVPAGNTEALQNKARGKNKTTSKPMPVALRAGSKANISEATKQQIKPAAAKSSQLLPHQGKKHSSSAIPPAKTSTTPNDTSGIPTSTTQAPGEKLPRKRSSYLSMVVPRKVADDDNESDSDEHFAKSSSANDQNMPIKPKAGIGRFFNSKKDDNDVSTNLVSPTFTDAAGDTTVKPNISNDSKTKVASSISLVGRNPAELDGTQEQKKLQRNERTSANDPAEAAEGGENLPYCKTPDVASKQAGNQSPSVSHAPNDEQEKLANSSTAPTDATIQSPRKKPAFLSKFLPSRTGAKDPEIGVDSADADLKGFPVAVEDESSPEKRKKEGFGRFFGTKKDDDEILASEPIVEDRAQEMPCVSKSMPSASLAGRNPVELDVKSPSGYQIPVAAKSKDVAAPTASTPPAAATQIHPDPEAFIPPPKISLVGRNPVDFDSNTQQNSNPSSTAAATDGPAKGQTVNPLIASYPADPARTNTARTGQTDESVDVQPPAEFNDSGVKSPSKKLAFLSKLLPSKIAQGGEPNIEPITTAAGRGIDESKPDKQKKGLGRLFSYTPNKEESDIHTSSVAESTAASSLNAPIADKKRSDSVVPEKHVTHTATNTVKPTYSPGQATEIRADLKSASKVSLAGRNPVEKNQSHSQPQLDPSKDLHADKGNAQIPPHDPPQVARFVATSDLPLSGRRNIIDFGPTKPYDLSSTDNALEATDPYGNMIGQPKPSLADRRDTCISTPAPHENSSTLSCNAPTAKQISPQKRKKKGKGLTKKQLQKLMAEPDSSDSDGSDCQTKPSKQSSPTTTPRFKNRPNDAANAASADVGTSHIPAETVSETLAISPSQIEDEVARQVDSNALIGRNPKERRNRAIDSQSTREKDDSETLALGENLLNGREFMDSRRLSIDAQNTPADDNDAHGVVQNDEKEGPLAHSYDPLSGRYPNERWRRAINAQSALEDDDGSAAAGDDEVSSSSYDPLAGRDPKEMRKRAIDAQSALSDVEDDLASRGNEHLPSEATDPLSGRNSKEMRKRIIDAQSGADNEDSTTALDDEETSCCSNDPLSGRDPKELRKRAIDAQSGATVDGNKSILAIEDGDTPSCYCDPLSGRNPKEMSKRAIDAQSCKKTDTLKTAPLSVAKILALPPSEPTETKTAIKTRLVEPSPVHVSKPDEPLEPRPAVLTSEPAKVAPAPEPEPDDEETETEEPEDALENRIIECFIWYARMGQPNRDNMKRRIAAKQHEFMDIIPADVDLLPWNSLGSMISVKNMNAFIFANDTKTTADERKLAMKEIVASAQEKKRKQRAARARK
ncbi:hypothetical protein MPSEU_000868300 [Mayamaea pseudoterrestris]|nr:hypothetical protein MPSEU_000868300 [Mayamaea pseudoterrestris]